MSQINVQHNSMSVTVQAYKSVVSDYALRTKQAEEMVTVLMNDKIPQDRLSTEVVNKVYEHMNARGVERSAQYLGLLQTTLMALTEIQKHKPDPDILEIIKSLTLATGAQ